MTAANWCSFARLTEHRIGFITNAGVPGRLAVGSRGGTRDRPFDALVTFRKLAVAGTARRGLGGEVVGGGVRAARAADAFVGLRNPCRGDMLGNLETSMCKWMRVLCCDIDVYLYESFLIVV
jgi:hypothetical protein